jgi:hypothetical protein
MQPSGVIMRMKYIACDGSKPTSKYYPGFDCMETLRVTENVVYAVCWKCLARKMPAPEQKKTTNTGFPRGWKFMNEFVHESGKVYKKGVEAPELFGSLPPTEIKEYEPRKKKETLDDKIQKEFIKKIKTKKSRKSKSKKGKL